MFEYDLYCKVIFIWYINVYHLYHRSTDSFISIILF